MAVECCKFYPNKKKIVLYFFISIIFVLIGIGAVNNFFPNITKSDIFVGYCCILFFGLCSTIYLSKLLNSEAYIEITPLYIKIGNWDKLLWTDIINIREIEIRKQEFLYFYVKDIKKFKLTIIQKLNQFLMGSPFYITFSLLGKSDCRKIKCLVKEAIAENKLIFADYQSNTSNMQQ